MYTLTPAEPVHCVLLLLSQSLAAVAFHLRVAVVHADVLLGTASCGQRIDQPVAIILVRAAAAEIDRRLPENLAELIAV